MLSLLRMVRPQRTMNQLSLLAKPKNLKPHNVIQRFVSATPKKNDDSTNREVSVKKTWVSYGFDYENEKDDKIYLHFTMFICVSVCLVGGAFIMCYLPDVHLRDWAQREAYLLLRYREEHGLPLIDINVVDPANFTLPTDEEIDYYFAPEF
ncbi:NADH dehydrogenase [ubiquinone] 1 beta subcomplex subunit NP15.6 [Megalopta genalis]|uniref:NADH dehydrogenase [ubiquinone] 1 beta subcomplex subunit NP15.6 n=1 Tax=Megalopta genalis TaxID=115081 RepID=UPI003FD1FF12